MNRLDRFHKDGSEDAAAASPVASKGPAVPPKLPTMERYVAPVPDDREFASTACPNCATPIDDLTPYSTACKTCEQPIVVKAGEDGKWHLLREDDMAAFAEDEEQVLAQRYEAEEAMLREAGFLIGDRSVDVVDEADYQETLEGLAGGRSDRGTITQVVALLIREPERHREKDAVRVEVDGAIVGYIGKWDAKDIQPLMRRLEAEGTPAWVRGNIVGGWADDGGDEAFRIRLDALPSK
jgi:hypothetical protein